MKSSAFNPEQLKELKQIIKDDIADLFFALFLKKKSWQGAMKESVNVDKLDKQITEIIKLRMKNMRKTLDEK